MESIGTLAFSINFKGLKKTDKKLQELAETCYDLASILDYLKEEHGVSVNMEAQAND